MGTGEDPIGSAFHTDPSLVIVEHIAQKEGVDVADLCPPEYPPLHTAVDPQALDTLLAGDSDKLLHEQPITVRFQYCGYEITVSNDGELIIEPQ
ncbi:HalOD1 output domain-containing protein [Natrialbaceae archaeon A-CW2]|uniref:HalOD1 output domain-containing protein n=1 Tax=Natronosalvus amylolyticus TaxID=2961994 RepID=UPI0020CA1BA6|nr:HalOD1 output domain-containing protein [Natronosalvus amylolyticus]